MGDTEKTAAESGGVELSAPEAAEIRDDFTRRWWLQLAFSGQIVALGLPALLYAQSFEPATPPAWVIGVAGLSFLTGFAGSLWNWRCPHCRKYFGKKFFGLQFCANCGVPLV